MGKSILIVDDSASVRQVVGISLRQAGYERWMAGRLPEAPATPSS